MRCFLIKLDNTSVFYDARWKRHAKYQVSSA